MNYPLRPSAIKIALAVVVAVAITSLITTALRPYARFSGVELFLVTNMVFIIGVLAIKYFQKALPWLNVIAAVIVAKFLVPALIHPVMEVYMPELISTVVGLAIYTVAHGVAIYGLLYLIARLREKAVGEVTAEKK